MPAYGFPDTARLGLVDSEDMELDSCPAGVATIVPGDLLFSYDGENKVYPLYADTAKIVLSGDLVTSNVINASIDSVAIAPVTFATSHAATMTLLIAAINALTGCVAILDTTDTNSRTILIRKKTVASFAVTVTVTLGASQATGTYTYASGQLFRGVAKYVTRVPGTVGGTGTFAIGEEISVVHNGDVWSASASGLARGDVAYIATNGKFGTSGIVVGARGYAAYDSAAAATLIRLPKLPAPMTYGDRF